MEETKRYSNLDVVAGLLVIWMIYFDHLRYMAGVQSFWGVDFLKKIFFFFMAWFFFKSGMFFKDHRTVKEVAKHDFRKFVVPYLIGCCLAMFLQLIYLIVTGQFDFKPFIVRNIINTLNHGGASWNIALWFLVSLYIVKIIFRWAISYIHPILIAFIAVLISFILYHFGIFRPSFIGNIPLGLFFYSIGFLLRDLQYNRIMIASAIIMSLLLFLSNTVTSLNFRLNKVGSGDDYLIVMLACISNILVFNNLTKIITPPLLAFIGKQSMIFYVLHFPIGMLFSRIGIDYFHLDSMKLYLFTCIATTIMLAVLYFTIERSSNKFIKMIIGQ